MQIEVKEVEDFKVDVFYEADKEQIENKRKEVLNLFKKAPVKGWRPGAANIEVIKIQYRKEIDEALKRALVEEAFHNTIFEKSIKPFGVPEIKKVSLLNNKFSCEFSMHKRPDFEIAPYKDLEIPKQHIEFTAVELEQRLLQDARIRFGESIPFEENDFVQQSDNIIIDYKAFQLNDDGSSTELTNLSQVGELLTVGKGQLSGFDDNLLGMKMGEIRSFSLKIPETGLPSVAGKDVKFEVLLTMGSKVRPMPLNDELAAKMGKKDMQEVQQFIAQLASAKVAETEKLAHIKQVQSRLLADNPIKVPHWLTLSEAQYLSHSASLSWESLSNEDKEKYLQVAEDNVRLALILDKIREEEPEAQLTDQEVLDMIRYSLSKTGQNAEDAMKVMMQNGYLNILAARIRDEFVVDFVLKNSKIVE